MAGSETCATCRHFVEETGKIGEWSHEQALRCGRGFCLTDDLYTVHEPTDRACDGYSRFGNVPVSPPPVTKTSLSRQPDKNTIKGLVNGKVSFFASVKDAALFTRISEKRILWCINSGRRWRGWKFSME